MRNDIQFYCCHNLVLQQSLLAFSLYQSLEQHKCFCVVSFSPCFFIFCAVQLSLPTSCPHLPLGVITWPNQTGVSTPVLITCPFIMCRIWISLPPPPPPAYLNDVILPFYASLPCVVLAAVQLFSCTRKCSSRCQLVLIEFNFVPHTFNCFADTSKKMIIVVFFCDYRSRILHYQKFLILSLHYFSFFDFGHIFLSK